MIAIEKLATLILILFLCLGLFSCNETAKNSGSKLQTAQQSTIGKVDSTFHFKDKVNSILEDRNGNFWVGSKENGLCKYNGKNYTYYTTNDGLSSNSILSLQEDKVGSIWFDNRKDIIRFDGMQFMKFDKKYIPTIDVKNNPLQLSKQDLWFNDVSRLGVFRDDGKDLSFISFNDSSLNLTQDNNHFFVSSITDLVNDQVWFGTLMQGAIGFDGGKFERIKNESMNFESEEEFLHIRSMLADSKGNLWIGNNGVGVILKKKDSVIHFSKKQGKLLPVDEFVSNTEKRQFSSNTELQSVFAIEEDSEGNIWFGDRDSGAWKYDGKHLYNYKNIYHQNDLETLIWDIYNDKNGNLYFILADGSVFTFNGKSFDKFEGF